MCFVPSAGDARRRRILETRDEEERRELELAGGAAAPAAAGGAQALPGRQTGSLAWRAARGELGANPAAEAATAAAAGASASVAVSPPPPGAAPALHIPGAKPLPDDLVLAAATRVAASAGADKLDVVRRLLRNVLKDPDCERYRRLKMSNAKIATAVGGGTFGKELLVALGFVAKNDAKDGLVFVLGPGGADVSAAVLAIQLALRRLEEAPGAVVGGNVRGEGGSGVNAVTDATGKLDISTAATCSTPPPPHSRAAAASAAAEAPAQAPITASASPVDVAKDALQKAVHAEFSRLVNEDGVAANEAAAMAINNVRAKMTTKNSAAVANVR